MYECPRCRSHDTVRIRRSAWMRLFPTLVRVRCRSCDRTFVKFVKTTTTRSIDL